MCVSEPLNKMFLTEKKQQQHQRDIQLQQLQNIAMNKPTFFQMSYPIRAARRSSSWRQLPGSWFAKKVKSLHMCNKSRMEQLNCPLRKHSRLLLSVREG